MGARADFNLAAQKAGPGHSLDLCQAIGYFGHAAFRLGNLVEAVEYGERAVTVASESEHLWELAMLHALAALPRAARGEFEEAERHVVIAYEKAADMGTRSARAYASEARAFLAQAQDDASTFYEAATDFTEAYGSLEPGAHIVGPVLAEALVALGRFEEASSAIEEFEKVVRETGRRSARAAVARVKGELAVCAR